ncbi:MAG: C1 family peptidase, partial [Gemmatimonadota bacterium]
MAKKRGKVVRNVRPDAVDFRDLPFRPNIALPPAPHLFPRKDRQLPVKNQGDTSACTGFGLSLVVEYLLHAARRQAPEISAFMLYSMARRYDEFPGSGDQGSSLRGALKGWYKHGACTDRLWKTGVHMPPAPKNPEDDWWLDAVRRPLGAYYRIDRRALSDMHAALNEVGILYASAVCHAGWDAGYKQKQPRTRPTSFAASIFTIPVVRAKPDDGGHAFAIVGYDENGFLLQNSWGDDWGTRGYAILTYDDWLANAMDCWVAQLGVVTSEHLAIARAGTLRTDAKGTRVSLSVSSVLRDREIAPFVIDMGNNGRLSNSGQFRTTEDDVRAIVDIHLAEARKRWGLVGKPVDVCIYAHGGLVGEKDAAASAAKWIPLLYRNRIFPVFLMWETDLLTTVVDRISDAVAGVPRAAGAREGFWSSAERWWNERLERLLARPGTELWGEMKQNAAAISAAADTGAGILYRHFMRSAAQKEPLRLHLVGHSAGSIVHAHIVDYVCAQGMKFESVSFMAPAVRVDTFDRLVAQRLADRSIRRYLQFHLTEKAEEDDPTCGPYRRSLLWLVSASFEGGQATPILGMEKFYRDYAGRLKNATAVA